ncbi:MAG: pyridoxal 5'-phosphate synthase glutaminase subunit PdxT [Myxococcales bacterium]|nr:pyridoxal 5'-phosphate synthase glutaminase subunit PdxT [Myxococcales bacterium]
MKVGILALQGDVAAHRHALDELGCEAVAVRWPRDLAGCGALILPGGESTTIAKGMTRQRLYEPIRAFAAAGGAILGTCAGAILLSRTATAPEPGVRVGHHPVETLGLLDVAARRNAYGTQVDSFVAAAVSEDHPELDGMRCVFIRAPQLVEIGEGVEVWARVEGLPVLVREGRMWASTFHPELGADSRVHRLLVESSAL